MSAADEVIAEDVVDSTMLHPRDDTLDWERPPGQQAIRRPATTGEAVELVAAGVGLFVVPRSLARLHHRRDLTYRPFSDAPQSRVALSWLEDETTDLMEQSRRRCAEGRRKQVDQRKPPVPNTPSILVLRW